MIRDIVLASGNEHKISEMRELWTHEGFKIVSPDEVLSVEETGETFTENALIKAEAYFKKFNKPSLADDSGLVVDALPDDLGVKTARFGGEGLSDQERSLKLQEKKRQVY